MKLGNFKYEGLAILFLCSLSFSCGVSRYAFAQGDSPDTSFENKWYEINQSESFHKMSHNDWRARVGDRESEEYQVQKGDTLWGLSKTFFGNGYFWPKLWQVNSKFENPHEISPGQTIHFISGGGSAPEVTIGDLESDDAVDSSLQSSEDSDEDTVIATEEGDLHVPAEPKVHGVLKEIPRSLPNLSSFYTRSNVSDAGIYLEKETPIREDVDVPVRYFAMKNEAISIGEVTAVEGSEISGAWRGTIYFKLQSSVTDRDTLASIEPETRLRAYRSSDVLRHPESRKILGREFDYTADLQVIDETNEAGTYRARVKFSVDEVKVGDHLALGAIPHYRISRVKPAVEIPGVVIGMPYRVEGKGEGSSNYIFLNIGAAAGLKAGDHISIFGVTTKLKNGHEIYGTHGEAIIMSVSEQLASALVYKSTTLVRVGDLVGQSAVREVKADANDSADLLKQ